MNTYEVIIIKNITISLTVFLALACFSFVSCIRPIAQGYWFQTDSPILVLQIITTILLGHLFFLAITAKEMLTPIFKSPVVWVPFLIAFFSLLFAPFTPIPKGSLFGAPELGEGAFWFLALSTMIASTMLLMPHIRARQWLGAVALISALCVALLAMTPFDKPYYFNDYIAFYGIFSFGIVCFTWQLTSIKKQAVITLLCTIPIYISGNKSAIVLWGATIPATALLFWLLNHWAPNRKRFWAVLLTVLSPIPLFLAIAFIAAQYTPGGKLETLWSRYNLTQVVGQSIQLKPQILLTGMGWGSFADASLLSLDIQKTAAFEEKQLVWEFLAHRNPIHSHNELAEALLSLGLIGLLLSWLLYALFPLMAPSAFLPVATILGITSLTLATTWFQLPVSLPLMAIALGSCAKPLPASSTPLHKPISLLLLFLTLFSGWGAYDMLWTLTKDKKMKAPPAYDARIKETCGNGLVDFDRGGYLLAQYFRDFENQVKSFPEKAIEFHLFEEAQWLQCVVNRQWQHQPSLRLMASDLINISEWAHYDDDAKYIPEYAFDNWEEKINIWLQAAPKRTDLVAPYFLWKLSKNEEENMLPLLNTILEKNPNDPVGLWFSGIYFLSKAETFEKGRQRMQRALTLGIDRIMPIDSEIVRQL